MGAVMCGHNIVASEIQDRQLDYARDNLLEVNNIIQQVYHTRFRLPMSSVFIHVSQRTPYDPDDPANMYLPNPLFAEIDLVAGSYWSWSKAFGGAEHLLVRLRLSFRYAYRFPSVKCKNEFRFRICISVSIMLAGT
jgi:hypothetical protein